MVSQTFTSEEKNRGQKTPSSDQYSQKENKDPSSDKKHQSITIKETDRQAFTIRKTGLLLKSIDKGYIRTISNQQESHT